MAGRQAVTRRRRPRHVPEPPAGTVRATAPERRLDAVDAARGLAVCLMIAYHFCFDLRHFGWLAADFEHDPFWLGARTLILSLFLALTGISLVLADRAAAPRTRYWRRIAVIAACAAAVSVGSYLVFPRTFIAFGVLHCIVVATLLARPLVRHPRAALAVGLAMIAAGNALSHPLFDDPVLSFIGLRTYKPSTEDYVPLLPWAGVTLLGVALAGASLAPRIHAGLAGLRPPAALAWLGRHSLAVYMAHQPLLLGLLWLVSRSVTAR
ncbi:MAG: DUF1624 domain-containing protein [Betaproteobacteria bacterium]|nr:DUF1624 domain-containing protein [Betaproteobacteria bacterium]